MQKKILFGLLVLFSSVLLIYGVSASTSEQIQIAQGASKVDVYVTSWCPYCRKMTEFLKQNGIAYTAYDIEKDKVAAKKYRSLGVQGVPVTVIGKKVIGGYNPDGVKAALR